jgi:hypothetical protein
MFLEVTDPRQGSNDWSCFVSHRLTVVNQKSEDRAVAKESQVRCAAVSGFVCCSVARAMQCCKGDALPFSVP